MRRLALVTIAFLALAAPAQAGTEDVANDVSNHVMSPFCPGVTLHDCPSQAALDLRKKIGGWAEQGWTREQIIAELEAQYGPGIRGAPATEGTGIVAWALPIAVLVAGVTIVVVLARRWSARSRRSGGGDVSPEDKRRLEIELDAFRSDA